MYHAEDGFPSLLCAQIAKKTGFRRPVAFGLTVFLVNVCGTLTFLSSGLLLASYLTKVRGLECDKTNKNNNTLFDRSHESVLISVLLRLPLGAIAAAQGASGISGD
jgi:hypothetical protein